MKRILFYLFIFSAGTLVQAQTVFQKAISFPFFNDQSEGITSIAPCSDGGYIFATSAVRIVKTDANGIITWSKNFSFDSPTSSISLSCIGECSGGGYYFLGQCYNGNYAVDFFTRMDASANIIWTKEFQANLAMEGTPSVFETTNGDFLISTTGMIMGATRLSSTGNIIFQKRYSLDPNNSTKVPPAAAAMSADGGMLITSNMTGLGLVKTDASGNIQWTKDYNDNSFSAYYFPAGVVATSDNGFVISGIDYMHNYMFLLKIDANGAIVWRKLFSSIMQVQITGMAQAPNGNLQLVGIDDNYGYGLALQFDASGNFLSGGTFGDTNSSTFNNYFTSLAVHSCPDNGMIIGGFCQNVITSAEATSIFKTDASGNLGCGYYPVALTDVSGSSPLPVDAQTIVYQSTVTGTVNQQIINCDSNSPIETDFCALFSGINNLPENAISLSVFPSPLSSGENLQLTVSGINGASTVSVYDANGKLVKQLSQEFFPDQSSTIEISTSEMNAGIYLVRITGTDQQILGMTKFIVK